ncbi:ankyrin [Thozetella sp. PMI_491]|nr:ankyrin [Thozetella sp. PMI_491]
MGVSTMSSPHLRLPTLPVVQPSNAETANTEPPMASGAKREPTVDRLQKVSHEIWKTQFVSAVASGEPTRIDAAWRLRAAASKPLKTKDEELMDDTLLDELFKAVDAGKYGVITPLINCRSTIVTHKRGRTILHRAVKAEDQRVVSELLLHSQINKGIDTKDDLGRTALHEAAILGIPEIIESLLANRADIDAVDNQYRTPLHAVVQWGHQKYATIKLLIDNGAEVNTRVASGDSPLHDAAAALAREADTKDDQGRLPEPTDLQRQDREVSEKIVDLLLTNGADAHVCNSEGDTPRDIINREPAARKYLYLFDDDPGKQRGRKLVPVPNAKPTCGTKQRRVSEKFWVSIWFYWRHGNFPWSYRVSVYDFIYTTKFHEIEEKYISFLQKEACGKGLHEVSKKDVWKWIHFPANNMTWVKVCLLTMPLMVSRNRI